MTYKVPAAVRAARAITINGVTYAKDQVLTAAQLKAIPHLSALLSSGRIYADPDVHGRKAVKGGHTPTNIPPVVLASITHDYGSGENQQVVVAMTALHAKVTVTGGQPPYTVNWGDSSTTTGAHDDPQLEHDYAAAGTYTVTVSGSEGDTYPTVSAVATTVPGAPTTVAGTDATGHVATVTWVAPAADGGSAITGYTIEWSADNFITVAGSGTDTASPYSAATGAGTWKFRVKATNANGTGPASAASANVVIA